MQLTHEQDMAVEAMADNCGRATYETVPGHSDVIAVIGLRDDIVVERVIVDEAGKRVC